MAKWTGETAAAAIEGLIGAIPSLMSVQRFSAMHSRWMANTLRVLEQVFGQSSRYYLTFAEIEWVETGTILVGGPGVPEGSVNPQIAIERRHQKAYLGQLDFARGILQAALDDLRHTGLAGVYHGKDTGPESSGLVKVLHLIENKLRKVVRQAPERERNIQDAFENILIGADVEYSREADSIEYSSKTYVPDFTFSRLDLAIDLKLCHRVDREKQLIAEINDDVLAYQTRYGNIVFIVYDLGHIRDADRFRSAFENHLGVLVSVKH
jgi:hypothetical protein